MASSGRPEDPNESPRTLASSEKPTTSSVPHRPRISQNAAASSSTPAPTVPFRLQSKRARDEEETSEHRNIRRRIDRPQNLSGQELNSQRLHPIPQQGYIPPPTVQDSYPNANNPSVPFMASAAGTSSRGRGSNARDPSGVQSRNVRVDEQYSSTRQSIDPYRPPAQNHTWPHFQHHDLRSIPQSANASSPATNLTGYYAQTEGYRDWSQLPPHTQASSHSSHLPHSLHQNDDRFRPTFTPASTSVAPPQSARKRTTRPTTAHPRPRVAPNTSSYLHPSAAHQTATQNTESAAPAPPAPVGKQDVDSKRPERWRSAAQLPTRTEDGWCLNQRNGIPMFVFQIPGYRHPPPPDSGNNGGGRMYTPTGAEPESSTLKGENQAGSWNMNMNILQQRKRWMKTIALTSILPAQLPQEPHRLLPISVLGLDSPSARDPGPGPAPSSSTFAPPSAVLQEPSELLPISLIEQISRESPAPPAQLATLQSDSGTGSAENFAHAGVWDSIEILYRQLVDGSGDVPNSHESPGRRQDTYDEPSQEDTTLTVDHSEVLDWFEERFLDIPSVGGVVAGPSTAAETGRPVASGAESSANATNHGGRVETQRATEKRGKPYDDPKRKRKRKQDDSS
ncbi:uncharacterized protein BXZ73DRAFT_79846 [Epithele typhae]|uniref:uncharacterized protein n=1 Tax=Epithele typhae TaxID=378194 RepID=UPI002007F2EE|nr:uncharacterized protein BXZ73DRAFT_79846 [Epithele typhae]KAH9921704.1 hypothetical protein BXZ73DRAFT_79846 [Epithele typhae]